MPKQTDIRGAVVTGVANVGIPVTDHDRAVGFYVDHLGFEVRRDATFGAGMRWVEVAPPGATTTIALAPTPPGKSAAVDTGIRLSVADADAAHASLSAANVDVDGEVMRLYASEWGERLRMRGGDGRWGQVTPPAWSRTRSL